MLKPALIFRSLLVFVLGLSLLSSDTFAQGWGNRGGQKVNAGGDKRVESRRDNQGERRSYNQGDRRGESRGGDRGDRRSYNRGDRYHYRDGRWYRTGWFGWEFAVAALTIGAFVEALPPQHTTVVVDNTTYYYDNNVYYRQLPDGAYVVVQQPVIVSPQVQPVGELTINVPNSQGGYTAVTLRRSGGGFVGPQGEYYQDVPSVDQLRALYGR